jgi:hypothetical protein
LRQFAAKVAELFVVDDVAVLHGYKNSQSVKIKIGIRIAILYNM